MFKSPGPCGAIQDIYTYITMSRVRFRFDACAERQRERAQLLFEAVQHKKFQWVYLRLGDRQILASRSGVQPTS